MQASLKETLMLPVHAVNLVYKHWQQQIKNLEYCQNDCALLQNQTRWNVSLFIDQENNIEITV